MIVVFPVCLAPIMQSALLFCDSFHLISLSYTVRFNILPPPVHNSIVTFFLDYSIKILRFSRIFRDDMLRFSFYIYNALIVSTIDIS